MPFGMPSPSGLPPVGDDVGVFVNVSVGVTVGVAVPVQVGDGEGVGNGGTVRALFDSSNSTTEFELSAVAVSGPL